MVLLQRVVDESGRTCKRKKLEVNAGKSKLLAVDRAREQKIDSAMS